MLRSMSADATTTPISPEAVACRRAAHERERRARTWWSRAVAITTSTLVVTYLCLLIVVRVMDPFYLIVNLLATMTGLCAILVYRVYELPTILAELPRLSDRDRSINLAAIEPIRSELLGQVLQSLGLIRRREEAAEIDDDELVRRLAGLRRPDWRRIARACFVAWLIVMSAAVVGVLTYRPDHGDSLLDRLQDDPADRGGPLSR